jgi:hypothetical protein
LNIFELYSIAIIQCNFINSFYQRIFAIFVVSLDLFDLFSGKFSAQCFSENKAGDGNTNEQKGDQGQVEYMDKPSVWAMNIGNNWRRDFNERRKD